MGLRTPHGELQRARVLRRVARAVLDHAPRRHHRSLQNGLLQHRRFHQPLRHRLHPPRRRPAPPGHGRPSRPVPRRLGRRRHGRLRHRRRRSRRRQGRRHPLLHRRQRRVHDLPRPPRGPGPPRRRHLRRLARHPAEGPRRRSGGFDEAPQSPRRPPRSPQGRRPEIRLHGIQGPHEDVRRPRLPLPQGRQNPRRRLPRTLRQRKAAPCVIEARRSRASSIFLSFFHSVLFFFFDEDPSS
mmetsp:Transcript_19667/g.63217  ORF Transcript_19667/g.63217 Transcript_19667/m.63217 type:complete len:240 (+) Transcript_19667:104-823(+)